MKSENSAPPRLLVIDDDEDTREVLAMEISSWGYDVRTAGDGAEGLAIAAEWRPAIVLCDFWLPGMDGCEVARRLRVLGLEPLKLVALTGFSTDDAREQIRAAGFDAHVVKGTVDFLEEFEKAVPRLLKSNYGGGC